MAKASRPADSRPNGGTPEPELQPGAANTAREADSDLPKKVKIVTDEGGKDEEIREVTLKEAKNLLKYEEENGFNNWKIQSGQGLTFKDGRIERGNINETQNPD